MASTSKLDLQIRSSNVLIDFFKKLGIVDSNILIEIRPEYVLAKTHSPGKHVVKTSKVLFGDVFGDSEIKIDSLKIGLYNIPRIIKIFGYFSPEDEITMSVEYNKSKSGDLVAKSITFYGKGIEITIIGAQMTLFNYITDDMMEDIADISGSKFRFILDRGFHKRLTNLLDIDTNSKSFTIVPSDDELMFKGSSFKLVKSGEDIEITDDFEVEISKKYLEYLDSEACEVFATDKGLVFKSMDSNTITVIGSVDPSEEGEI